MATQGQFSHTLQPQQHVCRAERRGGRRFGLAHERFGRAIVSEAVGCRRGRHCTKRPRETATKRSKNGRETVVKISIQLCLSQACLGSSLRFSRKEEACRGKIKRGQQVCVLCVCVLCFVIFGTSPVTHGEPREYATLETSCFVPVVHSGKGTYTC